MDRIGASPRRNDPIISEGFEPEWPPGPQPLRKRAECAPRLIWIKNAV
jgi:hypothetical protein